MRDQWYGDDRDLVKWGALIHIAQREHLSTILQVALYRPDHDWPPLRSSRGRVDIPTPVVRHFRNLDTVQRLAKTSGVRIEVFKAPFGKRAAYFEKARRRIASLSTDPLLVFLDPDTGLEGPVAGPEHVTPDDVRSVFEVLSAGDVLVCYQRARRQKDWRGDRRRAFTRALGVSSGDVEVFDSELAKDVVLFSVTKGDNRRAESGEDGRNSMNAPSHKGGPPPWIAPEMQQQIEWRDKDILISVPIKSGTTWTMNIVYQLLTGGDPNFEDIYAEVPWIEILTRPGMPVQELLDRVGRMPLERPRAFKTHAAPPVLPYVEPGGDKDVRYIVVLRNPEEALVSIKPFLEHHTDEWYELWQAPKGAMTRPDFPAFYHEVLDPMGMNAALFGFLQSWWPLRNRPNVLFLHFTNMKRDHEGSIRRIADFIGVRPTDEEWRAITEYTSFPWMKQHGAKFDASTATDVPVLRPGSMVRKGEVGAAREDGMTRAISEHLRGIGNQICTDHRSLQWFYEGGALPR